MNSSGKTILFVLIGVLVLGIFALVYWITSITNWDKVYELDDDYPYGTTVFQRLLKQHSASHQWEDVKEDLAEHLKNSPRDELSTYAFVGKRMYIDSAEIAEIQDFVHRGNTVFISSERFNSTLLEHIFTGRWIGDTLNYDKTDSDEFETKGFEIEDVDFDSEDLLEEKYNEQDSWSGEYDESSDDLEAAEYTEEEEHYYDEEEYLNELFLAMSESPYLDSKRDSMIGVYYPLNELANKRVNIKFKTQHETTVTQFDFWQDNLKEKSLVDFETIGNSTEGGCFIKVPFGDGEYLLHTVPLALTNYLLLEEQVFKYNQEVFSHLEASHVIWDESSRKIKPIERGKSSSLDASASLRDIEEGPLSFVLNTGGLKHAWFLMLVMVILFFIFGSKRKQRIIPVIHPPKNTSIEFAETLGHMFRQQNSHKRMIQIKSALFNDFVYQRYSIRMNWKSEEEQSHSIKLLSTKSGIPQDNLNKLLRRLNSANESVETKKRATQLIRIHQLLEEFYRKCK